MACCGVPGSDHSCIASESYPEDRNQEESPAFDLYAELYLRSRQQQMNWNRYCFNSVIMQRNLKKNFQWKVM